RVCGHYRQDLAPGPAGPADAYPLAPGPDDRAGSGLAGRWDGRCRRDAPSSPAVQVREHAAQGGRVALDPRCPAARPGRIARLDGRPGVEPTEEGPTNLRGLQSRLARLERRWTQHPQAPVRVVDPYEAYRAICDGTAPDMQEYRHFQELLLEANRDEV